MNKLFAAGILLVIFLCESAFAKSWRGITPLQETRAEVERRLGKPVLSSNDTATYYTDAEAVSIRYSTGTPCGKNANSKWNVPPGRVISITVVPKTIIQFSSLNLDESKYQKSSDPHRLSAFEYTNIEEGESITVVNGEVTRFDYTADSASNHFKCSSKSDSQATTSWYKLDEYGDLRQIDEESRLDNFAITLMQTPASKGYIYSYSGGAITRSKALARARRARNYLMRTQGLKRSRVIPRYIGRRTDFAIELYIVPKGIVAPVGFIPTMTPKFTKM